MPKTVARVRAVKKDAVLEGAVDVARAGAEAVAHPRPVGDHVGFEMVSERLGTHYFASPDAGYVGWCWAVTVARVPRGRVATVCEVDMTPREGALLAPEWVPWEERLRPSDISRDDVLPYKADDERLVQTRICRSCASLGWGEPASCRRRGAIRRLSAGTIPSAGRSRGVARVTPAPRAASS